MGTIKNDQLFTVCCYLAGGQRIAPYNTRSTQIKLFRSVNDNTNHQFTRSTYLPTQLYDFKRKICNIKKFIHHYEREQSVLRASEEFDRWSGQRRIEQLLKQLATKYPSSECPVVVQLVLQGYTIEEIAEQIERSSIAVRVLLHKCREKLKQLNLE